jgi:uncharacterized protein
MLSHIRIVYNGGKILEKINYEIIKQNPPITAVMNITDDCNLRCKYCFTHPHPTTMSLETGIEAVKWLTENYFKRQEEDRQAPHINFFGGEPTLRYEELMVPLMEWTDKNINPKLPLEHQFSWGMTTNGTLLTKERLRYLAARKDFKILFSCDGRAETQNAQRKTCNGSDSFPLIENKMADLLYYFPDVTFRSTITPDYVNNIIDDYIFAREKGFKNYFFMPNCREPWDLKSIQELGYQMSCIGWLMYQDIINERHTLVYTDLIHTIINMVIQEDFCLNKDIDYRQCGFGCNSVGITTNGIITACQERNTYDQTDLFVIGDIYKGIDKFKHLNLLHKIEEQPKRLGEGLNCQNCTLQNKCSIRLCPSTNYDMTGNPCTCPSITCYWQILLYEVGKAICETAALEDNEKFSNFLKNNAKNINKV